MTDDSAAAAVNTVAELKEAHRQVAAAGGFLSLAIARRRYTKSDIVVCIAALTSAAETLEKSFLK